MAITWAPTTTPLNVAAYEATISVTRLDDVTNESQTFTVPLAPIQTDTQKLAVADEIWQKYQASVAKKSAVVAFVDTFNGQLKANLEAREG